MKRSSSNNNNDVTKPLLVVREDNNESGLIQWQENVVDVEEAKIQMLFSVPMILTNVFYYLIPLVSVMFAGHLGQLQLAGSTLANSWATVTCFAFMIPANPASFVE